MRLPESQDDVDRYSITPDDDYLMHGSRPFLHGGNPDGELTRLESGNPNDPGEASGHSGSLDEVKSIAWENALRVFTGTGEKADLYDFDKHMPGGEFGPPKRNPSPYVGPNPYVPNR